MHNLKHIDVNNFESDATFTTFLQQITGDQLLLVQISN